MRDFYRHLIYLTLGSSLLCASASYSQRISVEKLEQKVYSLNNQLKYNESQALLLPLLQDKTLSADYRYEVAVLLSYTYKRVFDYRSTLKFLNIARTFAEETPKRDQYVAAIRAEEAFVLFDTHNYPRADSLMTLLEKSGFKHINLENKSKLVMQQGYLLFLNKQYKQAEATYDKAIKWMRVSTPCHLPMIFVKKMQLYNAMNRLDLLKNALQQSIVCADSCHIIKYHLYANEELLSIYQSRNDLFQTVLIKKRLDSLNKIYAREENIASLHDQKEAILLKEKDQALRHEQKSKGYLTIILAGFIAVALLLVSWLLVFRRQKRKMELDFSRMKAELESYLIQSRAVVSNKPYLEDERLSGLSGRQREVLDCMATGMGNKQIADKLFISENTVKYHIKNIYRLLEIKDRKDFLVTIKK